MTSNLEALTAQAEKEWLQHWEQGPTRLRWEGTPLQIQDPAPDFELHSSRGGEARLSEFWKDKPALILFWRHFGCSCGLARGARLREEYADYVKAGAEVVIVGQGEPLRAVAYAEKYALPDVPILSDERLEVYRAYGLLEGRPAQLLFDAPDEYLRCEMQAGLDLQQARREKGQYMVDNPWQLPGEFVVDSQGIVRLAYRYNYCEDYPDPRVLVAAIREATGELG